MVGQGGDRGRQGRVDDKGEADNWSGEETEACDVAEKKVNKMEYQESCEHLCHIKS